MHLTSQTLELGDVLKSGGAGIVYLPSNKAPAPVGLVQQALSSGASLLQGLDGLDSIAKHFPAHTGFYIIEGNGKIFSALHQAPPLSSFFKQVKGISEHTSGGDRLVDAYDPNRLVVPIVAVYKNALKTVLETGLGTSQTVVAALLRGLRRPLAGRRVVVVGFGNMGRGTADLLRILGARVAIVETSKEARLKAHLAGYQMHELSEILPLADICLTTTGSPHIISTHHLANAKIGIVFANVSNAPDEIYLEDCQPGKMLGDHLQSWSTPEGRNFQVLGAGIQVNHAVEQGNPGELMDLSFTLHALSVRWLVKNSPLPGLYPVPPDLCEEASARILGEFN